MADDPGQQTSQNAQNGPQPQQSQQSQQHLGMQQQMQQQLPQNQIAQNRGKQGDSQAAQRPQQLPMQSYQQQPHNQMNQAQGFPAQRPQPSQHQELMHHQAQKGQMPYPAPSQHPAHHQQHQQQLLSQQSNQQHQQLAVQQQASQAQQHHQHQQQQTQAQQQAQHQAQLKKQQQEQDQSICYRINEEVSNLCHLDNYVGNHSNIESLYKKIQRLQYRGKEITQSVSGQRERKREEPPKEVAHQDFLMKEMQDMAQDFHEETYFKRYMLAKLAYEAQSVALQKMRNRAKNSKESAVKVISGPNAVKGDGSGPRPRESQVSRPSDEDDFLPGPGPRPDLKPLPDLGRFPEANDPANSDDPFPDTGAHRPQPLMPQESAICPLLGPNTPTRPNIDLDVLFSGHGENQNEGIKSDLDSISKKSLQDGKNDRNEDQKLHDVQDDGLNRLPEDLKNQEEKIDSTGQPRKDKIISEEQERRHEYPIFINKDDILTKDADLVQSLGDAERRNQEFEQLTKQSKVDSKFLCYDDNSEDLMIEAPLNEFYVKDLVMGDEEASKQGRSERSNLYQNKVVKMVESYYEDKYADLEKKRFEAEAAFESSLTFKLQRDHQHHLGNEEQRNEARHGNFGNGHDFGLAGTQMMSGQQQQINIDSLFNDNNQVGRGPSNQIDPSDQMRRGRGIADQNNGRLLNEQYDPYINPSSGYNQGASSAQPDQQNLHNQYAQVNRDRHFNHQADNLYGMSAQQQNQHNQSQYGAAAAMNNNDVADQPAVDQVPLGNQATSNQSQAPNNGPATSNQLNLQQLEEMQAEIVVQQDLFQFYDDRCEEMDATRSQTHHKHDFYSTCTCDSCLGNKGSLKDFRGDGHAHGSFAQPNNQGQYPNLQNDPNLNHADDMFDLNLDGFNEEVDREQEARDNERAAAAQHAKVLKGVYREGESFPEDVCTQTDRELMRIFPSITEPEHTKILLDIYLRRKHLEGVARHVNKIAEWNHALIQQERLGPYRDQTIIDERKEDIAKEEQKMWSSHREFCGKRHHQTRDCSQKFKNVHQNSPQTMKDLKKLINDNNRKNNNQKQMQIFNDSEVAFMRWYVSIFGDNWRLIANVLNYHPFTRGYLRSKDSLQTQFIYYMNSATHASLLNENSVIKPWRTTGMPVLIAERPPSLYCSIKQINQMHHTCIKNYDMKRLNPKKQDIFKLKAGQDGFLKIEFAGTRKVVGSNQLDEVKKGVKRSREGSTMVHGDDAGRDDEKAALEAGQQLGERAFQSQDSEMKDEESDSYISQFYLGQKIDEVLKGDLKRPAPNFSFQSCHNRRSSYSKLWPRTGGVSAAKRQRVGFRDEVHVPSNQIGASEQPNQLQVSPEEMNTPMFCALHENKNNNKSVYQKSVLHQSGIMFWLGYLYKKIAQNRCEQKVRLINERSFAELKKYEKNLAQQIATQHTREAKRTRLLMQNRAVQAQQIRNGQQPEAFMTPQQEQEAKRRATLERELASYTVERSSGLLPPAQSLDMNDEAPGGHTSTGSHPQEEVRCLWRDRQSIFFYDKAKLAEYQHQEEEDLRGERKLDSIIDIMEMKWERMDRYWFQKHRHLDQKMRKKKDDGQFAPQSSQQHPQSQQQQHFQSAAANNDHVAAQYNQGNQEAGGHNQQPYSSSTANPNTGGMQPPPGGQQYQGGLGAHPRHQNQSSQQAQMRDRGGQGQSAPHPHQMAANLPNNQRNYPQPSGCPPQRQPAPHQPQHPFDNQQPPAMPSQNGSRPGHGVMMPPQGNPSNAGGGHQQPPGQHLPQQDMNNGYESFRHEAKGNKLSQPVMQQYQQMMPQQRQQQQPQQPGQTGRTQQMQAPQGREPGPQTDSQPDRDRQRGTGRAEGGSGPPGGPDDDQALGMADPGPGPQAQPPQQQSKQPISQVREIR